LDLASGTRLGVYEVVSPLGVGGMGEVYRARDTRLGRDVAIKILPELFVGEPERVARFQREAQLLAALNHPNIAAIYGYEEAASPAVRFLVMELVDGESIAQRLRGGPMPLVEATGVARQVADALQAAHDRGIIHRDLKPANVMVTTDGHVKVLDFGLAKMLAEDRPEGVSSATMSPTLSVQATYAGVILGTAAYMSPEQARGKAADKRTDVWAFGCLLYEMLAGRRAFEGEDVTDTIAAVVRGEPDWNALPRDLPREIRAIITRCLQKDRRQRFADVSVVSYLLDQPAEAATTVAPAIAEPRPIWKRALPIAASALAAATFTGVAMWRLRPNPPPPVVSRFSIPLGQDQRFTNPGRHLVAISADGRRIVYAANLQLYLRSASELEGRPIPGTETTPAGSTNPIFSPDGQFVVFFGDSRLKKIAAAGGVAVTLCAANNPFGIDWQGDQILFGQGQAGIMRVSANGGAPERLVEMKDGQVAHGPQLLPGGDAVLFTVAPNGAPDGWDKADIVVQLLKTGERRKILSGASDARYLPTGHLVYAAAGIVFAVRFDINRLTVVGGPVPAIDGVSRALGGVTGAAHFNVSQTGTLVYIAGPASSLNEQNDVAIADRQGGAQPLKLPAAAYEYPRASPDGKRIAVGTDDGKEAVIWIYELSGASARRRLTLGGNNRTPVWAPDGERVAFQSDRDGDQAVFWQKADGSGAAERLTKPDKAAAHIPQSFAPDGRTLLVSEKRQKYALGSFSLSDRQWTALGVESTYQISAAFSPDGRWIAYNVSSGGVYVETFPATGAKYPMDGGIHPIWSRDGKELFYLRPGRFEGVTVATQPAFTFSNPVALARGNMIPRGPTAERNFDVLPDGRFVVIVPRDLVGAGQSSSPQIQIVEHWFEELKTLVPAK